MKSMFLKTIKVVALSLVISLGAADVVLANGAGAPPTATALNGAGNGAGGTVKRKTKVKRTVRRATRRGRRGATKA